jgi:hypothetical protein
MRVTISVTLAEVVMSTLHLLAALLHHLHGLLPALPPARG